MTPTPGRRRPIVIAVLLAVCLGGLIVAVVSLVPTRSAASATLGCYEWLGKVLNVITDGAFEHSGCPKTAQPQACARGARSYSGPLITFS